MGGKVFIQPIIAPFSIVRRRLLYNREGRVSVTTLNCLPCICISCPFPIFRVLTSTCQTIFISSGWSTDFVSLANRTATLIMSVAYFGSSGSDVPVNNVSIQFAVKDDSSFTFIFHFLFYFFKKKIISRIVGQSAGRAGRPPGARDLVPWPHFTKRSRRKWRDF